MSYERMPSFHKMARSRPSDVFVKSRVAFSRDRVGELLLSGVM